MIERFVEWAANAGWIIERNDEPISFPEGVLARYKNIPEEWLEFIANFKSIKNAADDVWFLTGYDFADTQTYFEDISLDAAAGDEDWIQQIKAFWDKTLPIFMSVGGDYQYYGIDLETGKVVEGWEPEFEYPYAKAGSFNEFIEKLISGEIIIAI